MDPIKIVVAGDNYLFTKGMECLIEESPYFDLSASVQSEAELIDAISYKKADVLAIDVSSIGWNTDTLNKLKKYAPLLKILAFNTVKAKDWATSF